VYIRDTITVLDEAERWRVDRTAQLRAATGRHKPWRQNRTRRIRQVWLLLYSLISSHQRSQNSGKNSAATSGEHNQPSLSLLAEKSTRNFGSPQKSLIASLFWRCPALQKVVKIRR